MQGSTIVPPKADEAAHVIQSLAKEATEPEIILLVDDEDMVRLLARRILESRGYAVLEARDGQEGLALCETHEHGIDLLLTDLMMPKLGGTELALGARKLLPKLKILFMSGYSEVPESVETGTAFLRKPFTPIQLAQEVRETIDASGRFTEAL